MHQSATFRQMKDGSREEFLLIEELERPYVAALPDRLLAALQKLATGLEGFTVDRLTHSCQSATRALRDGADIELIVAALIHDVGDDLSPYNHAAMAAEIIRPYVRPEVTWIVEQHGLFQSYYYAHHYGKDRHGRERFRDHRWFAACESFCERWDQSSFDPDYDTLPLSHFEPMLREVFSRPAFDPRYVGVGLEA